MYRIIIKSKPFILGLIPISGNYHTTSDINDNNESRIQNLQLPTGWEGVKKVFKPQDETGNRSPELDLICSQIFAGATLGIIFGGLLNTRHAVQDFIDKNMASRFISEKDAKRRVRDHVIIKFAKGAIKWCPRFTIFSAVYASSTVLLNAYSGETTVKNFVIGGMLTGALFKVDMGTRAILVGAVTAGLLSGVANGIILLTMRLTGISMEDLLRQNWSQFNSIPGKTVHMEGTAGGDITSGTNF